jgi:hypothetical protein
MPIMKNTKKHQPGAFTAENPSNKTAEGSSDNSAALAVALLGIYRPYIPRHFSEAKPVWWLLDADDRRACKVSKFIAPQFDLREAADSAGPKKRVVTMELTDLSKLNSYLRTEGHIELPAPPFGKGYVVVCSAGKVLLSVSPNRGRRWRRKCQPAPVATIGQERSLSFFARTARML